MGVMVEGIVWQPNALLYVIFFICILLPLVVSPSGFSSTFSSSPSSSSPYSRRDFLNSTRSKSTSPFDLYSNDSVRFHRRFLLIFALASGMEGMWSIFGEYDFAYFNAGKEDILASICLGYSISLLYGAFVGCLFDFVGHRKACFIFFIVHLAIGMWNRTAKYPNKWFSSVLSPIATSIFSCSFESWLVIEHKEQCYRQATLTETLWLMTFIESVMLIGTQAFVNKIVKSNLEPGIPIYSTASILVAIICIIYLRKGGNDSPSMRDSRVSRVPYIHLFQDQRVLFLGLAHSCLHFSVAVFWVLWAPTLIADGRELNLGMLYTLLMGARMVGSSVFQWLLNSSSSLRTEDTLVYAFVALGIVLSIIAYDYQEIGALVSLFCVFHMGVGFIFPSLAKLRAMHVPNEIRGGMIGLSITPANALMLFLLIQRGYYGNVENSTMMAIAAVCMFIGSGCVYCLRLRGKLLHQNGHKL